MKKFILLGILISSLVIGIVTIGTLEKLQDEKKLRRVRMLRSMRSESLEHEWIDLSSP